jgi:hypothetical protein
VNRGLTQIIVPGEKGGTANALIKPSPLFGAEAFFIFHHHTTTPEFSLRQSESAENGMYLPQADGVVYNQERSVARHGKGTDEKTEAGRPATHQDF